MNNITKKMINSITKKAKNFAKSMPIGNSAIIQFQQNSTTLIIKKTGKSIATNVTSFLNITVAPSRDFENSTHIFDIFVSFLNGIVSLKF